ncbi:MAG TPA: PA0069 family radical SAM protein [Phycisphaerales bacterium]|nr:PA0069 family radical SAM protein [Phycisphaerales bacterium]
MTNPFANPDGLDRRRDAGLTHDAVRGRGTPLNPANRFKPIAITLDGETLDDELRDHPSGVQVRTHVFRDDSRSVLTSNDSPDIPFTWSLNPYRGCEHGCIYCYARPGHEYLEMSCGIDFETKIMAKTDAPDLLRRELCRPSWVKPEGTVEAITMSGVTDPYQPLERKLKITRRCLEVMAEFRQPVGIITKNALVTRDKDILGAMAKNAGGNGPLARVTLSITSLDPRTAMVMEPRASTPRDRLRAVRELTDAGVEVSVMTAPILPGINDHEIPALLEAARDAGATNAGYILLRLPWQIKTLFLEWLVRHFPDRASRVESLIRQSRGGELYDAAWGERMSGTGPIADAIGATFKLFYAKNGLNKRDRGGLDTRSFKAPHDRKGQMSLF